MNVILTRDSLYPSPEHWSAIEAMGATLGPDQAVWLSGYFAGLSRSLRDNLGAASVMPLTGEPLAASTAPATPSRTLTILYASETGNSADLAQQIAARAEAAGLKAGMADLAGYKPRSLKDEQDLVIVTSTHGEGDPPETAVDFFEFVHGRRAPKLADTRFAVIGLGDSTYEFFCGASRKLDARLEELGAERLHERADLDVDYEDPAADWAGALLDKLAKEAGEAAKAASPASAAQAQGAPQQGAASAEAAHSKRNPFNAPVLDNFTLTGRGSTKETRHIELSLEDSGLSYEPGDALGLVPRNNPHLVENLLTALGLDAAEKIEVKAGEATLGDALQTDYEISVLTPRFIEHWAGLSQSAELGALVTPEERAELTAFMRQNHVIDIVRAYPVKGMSASDFTAGLRSLQPRLYSLASSLNAAPEEAHLAVSVVRYSLRDEPRAGVASGLLSEGAEPGETLPVYIQSNPNFRLPVDDAAPIIMIGTGTGIAPYRAFMQEREALGAGGRSWLLFGERNFHSDFLYQTEWQDFLKDGVLSRMDVAFSRDQAEKIYVHHRLREYAAELYGWLEDGAHFYVCGDATGFAPDVHRSLIDIVAQQGGIGNEKAEEYVRELQRDGRYQRDVY